MKKKMITLLCSVGLLFPLWGQSNQEVVLPKPARTEFNQGTFRLPAKVQIFEKNAKATETYLARILEETHGTSVRKSNTQQKATIVLENTKKDATSEKYTLTVSPNRISIEADGEKGLFYGVQSLLQLMENSGNGKEIPCQKITDAPRFAWRAFMLDESRYFKGEKEVLRLLDVMAALKMNVFHWHLTDDQGWRYESKKYPLLTEVGSKRKDTQIGGWNSEKRSGVPHEGFYTQEEIKRIVRYANERHIKIVPEIEIPGHASAAIAAYPWLGSKEGQIEVPVTFGKHYNTYNVTDPRVFAFLEDIVAEAIPLFNTDVVHIGGDEVRFNHWEENPQIVRYKEEKGFTSFMDIQIEAVNKMSKFIAGKNCSMMGWNEILGKNLHSDDNISFENASQKIAPNVIVHFWKGDLGEITRAAQEGYRLVNSYHASTYLDYGYKTISLRQAYEFDPIPADLPKEYHQNIYGSGCQMWSEWIPTVEDMNKQIYPRIAAYAEVGWSTPEKDFDHFVERVKRIKKQWDKKGIRGYEVPELD